MDSQDYCSCRTIICLITFTAEGTSTWADGPLSATSLCTICCRRISFTVLATIWLKFSLVKFTEPGILPSVELWFFEFPLASPISTYQFNFLTNGAKMIRSEIRGWDNSAKCPRSSNFDRLDINQICLWCVLSGRLQPGLGWATIKPQELESSIMNRARELVLGCIL